MYKKFISALRLLNVLMQALYSLALPIGIGGLASFLLTKHAGAPKWIWAVLITLGTFTGLYSMIKYVLTATAGLDRLEKQSEKDRAEREAKERMQSELRTIANRDEDGE